MRKFIDLTGNTYSNLTVVEKYDTTSTKSIWRCSCICGNECIVDGYNLKISHTQSCGCLQRERASSANKSNLVGKTFGKLTVVKEIKERQNRKIIWECLCECGIIKNIAANHLLAGKILSCGCHRKHLATLRSGSKSPLYNPLLSDTERKIKRTYPKYKKWMTTTKQNKNYTCEICLSKNNLHSHHLYSYNKYPELRLEEWNCAVLCKKCHINFHKKYGNVSNTFLQFVEFYKDTTSKEYENQLAKNYEYTRTPI